MGLFSLTTRTALSNESITVLVLEGVLDISTVGDFELTLTDLMKNKKYKIILNLEKLTYISSAGIGLLIGNLKDIRKKGGDIKIAQVLPDVYKVFDLLELNRVFHIFDTEALAVSEF